MSGLTKFEVYEDNAGGLRLFVLNGQTVVLGVTMYEDNLAEDIRSLIAGANPLVDWDYNEDDIGAVAQQQYARCVDEDRLVYDATGPVNRERWGFAMRTAMGEDDI